MQGHLRISIQSFCKKIKIKLNKQNKNTAIVDMQLCHLLLQGQGVGPLGVELLLQLRILAFSLSLLCSRVQAVQPGSQTSSIGCRCWCSWRSGCDWTDPASHENHWAGSAGSRDDSNSAILLDTCQIWWEMEKRCSGIQHCKE